MRHDRWWGNFVRTARVRMQELRKTQPQGTIITWLVYRDGYVRRAEEDRDPLTTHCESVRDTYKVNLVWFRSGDEVIEYINQGSAQVPRTRHRISGFEILRSLEQALLPVRLQQRRLCSFYGLAA